MEPLKGCDWPPLRGFNLLLALRQELERGRAGLCAFEESGIAGERAVLTDQKAIAFAGLAPGYEE